MSLADRRSVDDDGVTFRSPLDGQYRRLTPELIVEIQAVLGVDVAMVLDECIASPAEHADAVRARCGAVRCGPSAADRWPDQLSRRTLFGIVQGKRLRGAA